MLIRVRNILACVVSHVTDVDEYFTTVMSWVDQIRRIKVFASINNSMELADVCLLNR